MTQNLSLASRPGHVDADLFRAVLGRYATGVTVVSTLVPGDRSTGHEKAQPIGTTVNSFTSISLNPPLILIAIGGERTIHPCIAETKRFAVNILDEESTALSDCFAGAPSSLDRDAFCMAPYSLGTDDMPILDAALAYVVCELGRTIEAGDHTIYLGRIVDLGARASAAWPLLYYRGRYLQIEHAETTDLRGKPDAT